MLFSLVIAMLASGWLGCCARYAVNFETAKETEVPARPWDLNTVWSVLVLGAAAALVVPLFLSIANNNIMTDILAAQSFSSVASKILIVAGFCVLAGATAPNFIESLAQKALNLAKKNESKIEKVNEKADSNLELISEQIEAGDQGVPGAKIQAVKPPADLPPMSADEKQIVVSLNNMAYRRRTITGISKETGMSKERVRELLAALAQAGHVTQLKSSRTGVVLYELAM
ncbi:hypothetical protein CO731_03321 [Aminobacter sp. MSH1]|uniref:YEATS-associated helix-containing protein n=1 Tax=Aminobacter sp. MSH1 TaxID=374606 RepID=UPI000D37FF06|nr:YEATS-associated helix-containing protein [Aminobacter sp. MSH1]AWC23848.1 hypothetical protein CO731_03321 [Aminobacter sp. MSH1]